MGRVASTIWFLACSPLIAAAQCDRWEPVPGLELPGTNGPIADITTWDPDGAGPEPELLIAGGAFTAAGDVGTAGLAKFVTNPCAADLDCSGGVDSDDTIQFFVWWEASDSRADVNGDDGVDSDDTIAFFERWEAGC